MKNPGGLNMRKLAAMISKSEKSVFYIRTVSSDDQIVINPSVCLRTGSPDYQK